MRLYLAGPLFTLGERMQNSAIAELLRGMGHEVFLPQEQEQREATAKQIFESDIDGIEWAEAVVACMDGPDPDSGTCWEVGYGYARGNKLVLYRTDIRSEAPPFGPYNLMLHQAADSVLDCCWKSVEEIAAMICVALEGS